MHQHPAWFRVGDRAVVSDESASTAFIIHSRLIQGDIDGVSRGVVMRPQGWLFVRAISHDEIHEGSWWLST